MKKRIKAGDEIKVIAGNNKGDRGKVLQVFPRKDQILVEGINMKTRHQKANGADGQTNPDGGIVKREAPFHISNVMKVEQNEGEPLSDESTKKSKKKVKK
jgi:large subunit ribosomal protein L24